MSSATLRPSRLHWFTHSVQVFRLGGVDYFLGQDGDAFTTPVRMKLRRLHVSANVGTADGSNDTIVTVYNGTESASTEALIVLFDNSATGWSSGESSTEIDAGMTDVAAGGAFFVKMTAATSAVLNDFTVVLEVEVLG